MPSASRYFIMLALLLPGITAIQATAQTDSSFVLVPGGTYGIGGKQNLLNPYRKVTVAPFYMAVTELTNASFKKFVDATGYVTDAERLHNALVFEPGLEEFKWKEDSTACWRYPNGVAAGGIENKMDHPVTTISFQDALAYCRWAGGRLPTLPEWEIASRAGATTTYFWGDDQAQIGGYANIWQGRNHLKADSSDGYMYTAPVGRFKPNAWGLYDMYGNVFEFCSGKMAADRPGKPVAHARGGSWWCSKNACSFFNSTDIGRVHPRASFSNQGFRMVRSR